MNSYILIGAAVLLLVSVLASKISDRFGVPALLLFIIVGMLAGSEGSGGIYFDDPTIAQSIGIVALILILFSGGLDTEWSSVRTVTKEAALLATLGVLVTAVITGLVAHAVLGLALKEGLLLGAIVSSTDAAAVFSVLRSKGISLKGRLKPLLELESGSNDPMAVLLTVGLIQLIGQPSLSPGYLIGFFLRQMLVGAVVGYGTGKVALFLVNRLRLGFEGLYPVLTLSLALLGFGLTDRIGGSGFLAVYLAGIVLGNSDFIHKKSLLRFHDGMAWIMQIVMFLALGLLVFPSRIVPVAGAGLAIAACLMLVARPIAVFATLLLSRLSWREKAFISWVGLRGAVPVILATYPLLAGIPQAELLFNAVFFVVLTSVLLQGTSLPLVARWLKVDAPVAPRRVYPIEYTPMSGLSSELKELPVPPGSPVTGKAIVELGLPDNFLVILVARDNDFLVPSGGTVLQAGDILLALSDKESLDRVQAKLSPRG
ncbi:MAG TPA: potassium/proton antiporter [Anaerolineae bacterium]|nr:potassium/proton antiporter [Anaerolineae bacterium]